MPSKRVIFLSQDIYLPEIKFPQLLLYKSKLLTDFAHILTGAFYISAVYVAIQSVSE